MVGHKAVRVHIAFRLRRQTLQVMEIEPAIIVREKARGSVVTSLYDVDRQPGKNDACSTRHLRSTAHRQVRLTKNVVRP
jgi:hypothetical protein